MHDYLGWLKFIKCMSKAVSMILPKCIPFAQPLPKGIINLRIFDREPPN
jgi:hypothetical protein